MKKTFSLRSLLLPLVPAYRLALLLRDSTPERPS